LLLLLLLWQHSLRGNPITPPKAVDPVLLVLL
jgi:hypothetical protein